MRWRGMARAGERDEDDAGAGPRASPSRLSRAGRRPALPRRVTWLRDSVALLASVTLRRAARGFCSTRQPRLQTHAHEGHADARAFHAPAGGVGAGAGGACVAAAAPSTGGGRDHRRQRRRAFRGAPGSFLACAPRTPRRSPQKCSKAAAQACLGCSRSFAASDMRSRLSSLAARFRALGQAPLLSLSRADPRLTRGSFPCSPRGRTRARCVSAGPAAR